MRDLSRFSDEELDQIIAGTYKPKRSVSDYSDEELDQIISGKYKAPGEKPSLISKAIQATIGRGTIPGDIPIAEAPTPERAAGIDLTPPSGMSPEETKTQLEMLQIQMADPFYAGKREDLIRQKVKEGWADNRVSAGPEAPIQPKPFDMPGHVPGDIPFMEDVPIRGLPSDLPKGFPKLGTGGLEEAIDPSRADTLRQGARGLTAGTIGLAESAGTLTEITGRVFGSEKLMEIGKTASDYWESKAKEYAPPESIQGRVWDNPELLLDPEWWSYNTMQMVPMVAATVLPAMGAGRFISIAGRSTRLTPHVIQRLALLGASATGGTVGGALEGASTYKETLRQGATPEQALKAGAGMAVGTAILNAFSVAKMISRLPAGLAKKAISFVTTGATEAVTELSEEPWEVASKHIAGIPQTMDDVVEAIKSGLNVMGPSFLMGVAGGGAAGGRLEAPSIQRGIEEAAAPPKASPEEEARIKERVEKDKLDIYGDMIKKPSTPTVGEPEPAPAPKPKEPEAPPKEKLPGIEVLPPIKDFLKVAKRNQDAFREYLGVERPGEKAIYEAARAFHREMVLRSVEEGKPLSVGVIQDYFRWNPEYGEWQYHNSGGIWMGVERKQQEFLSKAYSSLMKGGRPVDKPVAPPVAEPTPGPAPGAPQTEAGYYRNLDLLEFDLRKKGAGRFNDIDYKIVTYGTEDKIAVERVIKGERETIVGQRGYPFKTREEAISWAKYDARIKNPFQEAEAPKPSPEPTPEAPKVEAPVALPKPEVTPEAKPGDQTPVSEVVKEGVKGAAREAIPIPQMKKYLLDKLDDAIKEKKAGVSEGETVEIEIPGDGVFTVFNNEGALKAFRERVQKRFPTKAEGKPTVPPGMKYPPVSKGEKRPSVQLDAVSAVGEYVSDGHFALIADKSKFRIKKSQRDVDALGEDITEESVRKVIPSLKQTIPQSKVEFLWSERGGEARGLGIADFPIAVTEKEATNVVRIIAQNGAESYIDQKYYVAIKDVYPDAEFRINKADPETAVIAVVDKGNIVGAVMPITVKDEAIRETREGRFPEIPESEIEEAKKRKEEIEAEDRGVSIEEEADLKYPDALAWLKDNMEKNPDVANFSEDWLSDTLQEALGYDMEDMRAPDIAEAIIARMIERMELVPVGASKLGERFYRLRKEGDRIQRPGKIVPPEGEEAFSPEGEVLESRGPGLAPEPGYKRTSEDVRETEEPSTEIVDGITRRSDIVKLLSEKFDIPIRVGRFRAPKSVRGIFKIRPEIIRTRLANDIRTSAHEIGHALNKFLWPTKRKGLSIRPLTPYEAELRPMATAGHPLKEGFAEFINKYVTEPEEALRLAPEFYAFFEAELEAKSPESRQILLEARKMFDRWQKQSDEAKVLSQISFSEAKQKGGWFRRFYTSMVHDIYPMELLVREMAQGKELPPGMDPHTLMRMMAGNEGRGDQFINGRPFKFGTYKMYGKGLREILDPIKDRLDEFRIYLTSKRTVELYGRDIATGIDINVARRMVEKYGEQFEKSRLELVRFQAATLRYMLEAGVIGFKDYIRMRNLNRDYVPFYRVADYMNRKGGKGKGFEVQRKPVKYMFGGEGDIIDPLESVIKNTYLFINAAERNAVGRALVKLAASEHGMGKYVEAIPPDRRVAAAIGERELRRILGMYGKWFESVEGQRVSQTIRESVTEQARGEAGPTDLPRDQRLLEGRAIEALTARGWTEAEAKQILDRIKNAPAGEARDRIIQREVTQTIVQSTVRTFGVEIPDGVHLLWRDSPFKPSGDVIAVMSNGRANFYEVHPDIYRTFMALDKESTGTLMRIIGAPTRLLRAGATLSLEFMSRNPIRDQITAYVFSRYGYKPGIDFFRGLYSVMKKDRYYQLWKMSGAEQAAFVSMDRAKNQQTLEDVIRDPNVKEVMKYVVKHPIDALRALSELGEEATRLGEFRKGLKVEGETKEGIIKAGLASREVTLDFRRIGLQGRSINQLIAFWNANVQGLDKTMRELKNEPGKVLPRIAAGITLPSILLAIANQDDERVRRLPAWEKWIFWHIPVGDTILRIPKPPLLGTIFGTIPQTMVWAAMDNKETDYEEMVMEIYNAVSPGWWPTPMNPFVENFANRSTFIDRPIVAKGREGLLNQYQYAPYTTEVAKTLGKYMGKIPIVGDSQLANPAKIENIVRGWTGNLGLMMLQTVNESLKKAGVTPPKAPEPAKTLSDIPLIRGFVSRYPSFGMEPINKFYEDYDKASRTKATAKALVKEGRVSEAEEVLQVRNLIKVEKIKKGLGKARQFIDYVYADPNMDPQEKRKLIDDTLIGMCIMAEEGNRVIYETRKLLKGK